MKKSIPLIRMDSNGRITRDVVDIPSASHGSKFSGVAVSAVGKRGASVAAVSASGSGFASTAASSSTVASAAASSKSSSGTRSVAVVSSSSNSARRTKREKSVTPPESDGSDNDAENPTTGAVAAFLVSPDPEDEFDDTIVQAAKKLEAESNVEYMDLGNGMRTAIFRKPGAEMLVASAVAPDAPKPRVVASTNGAGVLRTAGAVGSSMNNLATVNPPTNPLPFFPSFPIANNFDIPAIQPTNPLSGTFPDSPHDEEDDAEDMMKISAPNIVPNVETSADSATKEDPTVDNGETDSTTYTIVDVHSAFVDFFEKLNMDLDTPLTLRAILLALNSTKVLIQGSVPEVPIVPETKENLLCALNEQADANFTVPQSLQETQCTLQVINETVPFNESVVQNLDHAPEQESVPDSVQQSETPSMQETAQGNS